MVLVCIPLLWNFRKQAIQLKKSKAAQNPSIT
jgi:hypothetical protein